jgi:hypothetical protein
MYHGPPIHPVPPALKTMIDPGIIDGSALRKYVRQLSDDGTFAKTGISKDTAVKLQEFGALLERSKVVVRK